MAKRFYQIAFELGVPPRALITRLAQLGLSVGNQMVVVADPLEQRILTVYGATRPDLEASTAAQAAEPATATAVAEAEEEFEAAAPEAWVETAEPAAPPAAIAETVAPAPAPAAPTEPAIAASGAATSVPGVAVPGVAVPAGSAPGAAGEAATPAPAPAAPVPAAAARKRGPLIGRPLGFKDLQPKSFEKAKPASSGELIPTIDPRAGRLLKEAPKAGVPGVTRPTTRGPGPIGPASLNPSLARPAPAPGARRDGRTRGPGDDRGGERSGKQTFQLRSRRRAPARPIEPVDQTPKTIEVTPPVSVKLFSEASGLKIADIIKTLLVKHKQFVTPNSMLDEDTLVVLGVEFDKDIKFVKRESSEDLMLREAQTESMQESLTTRPPVVVVMGHVDHGKTSLLDRIRKADVALHEAGGITQHIGAYQVRIGDNKRITFFDTPGHEAFTEMRRRGAKVTDIVVLVVAADDGVMPQTVEAIDHAKAAEVPIVVAITKADRVGFKQEAIDRVKQQLAQHGVMVSGWGGEIECFPVAAVGPQAGTGVDKLLEHLVLLAEVEDLKADASRPATGTVIEAENNPGRGVLATLLVQQGTLRRGDALVAGSVWGRVRSLRDDKGGMIEEAGPGTPIEVTGLEDVPEVGKPFFVRPDVNKAREIAEQRRGRDREIELAAAAKPASLEGLFSAIEQGKVKALKVILKTDVQGSLEAIKARLDTLGNEEVRVQVIRAGVGAVTESDVTMAAAYGAMILGFHVVADESARARAKHLGVEVRMFRIIYELEEDVRAVLQGKLSPEMREQVLGHAEILQIFRSTKLGNIAGCRVRDGVIKRDAGVRLARGGIVVWEGRMTSLRREKDDAREVKEGFECGIRLEGYDDIKEGDVIEAFTVETVARTLEATS